MSLRFKLIRALILISMGFSISYIFFCIFNKSVLSYFCIFFSSIVLLKIDNIIIDIKENNYLNN